MPLKLNVLRSRFYAMLIQLLNREHWFSTRALIKSCLNETDVIYAATKHVPTTLASQISHYFKLFIRNLLELLS